VKIYPRCRSGWRNLEKAWVAENNTSQSSTSTRPAGASCRPLDLRTVRGHARIFILKQAVPKTRHAGRVTQATKPIWWRLPHPSTLFNVPTASHGFAPAIFSGWKPVFLAEHFRGQ